MEIFVTDVTGLLCLSNARLKNNLKERDTNIL